MHINQLPPSFGLGMFYVPPPYFGASVGTFAVGNVANPSHAELNDSNPASFQIRSDPYYQRSQTDMHAMHATTNVA